MGKYTKQIILASIVIVAITCVTYADQLEVKLTIPGYKNPYVQGECIPAKIVIKNADADTAMWQYELGYGVHLFNSEGDTFSDYYPGLFDIHKLPGNSEGYSRPTISTFRKYHNANCSYFLPPGSYSIYVRIKINDKEGKEKYIDSEKFNFKVIEPDKNNINIFRKYCNIWTEHGKRRKKLKEFVNKYPKSIYAPDAYYHWLVIGQLEIEKSKQVIEYEKLIQNYPDYPKIYWAVDGYARVYDIISKGNDVCEKIMALNKYSEKAKTSLLKDAIDEWLKKYNQNKI